MQEICFEAPEYHAAGHFQTALFQFSGDVTSGWTITRNGALHLTLGPGYVALQNLRCGVCATDLARHYLPYPLPQIIGHEVVALHKGRPVVVEINDSHHARGEQAVCPYCAGGLHSQCPQRMTLGIDRLPGGFAPWVLAPQHAVIPIPDRVDPLVAALTEPLAAALRGVQVTRPRRGERVAVLGPRRLGALCVAALAGFRARRGIDFQITALTRHEHLGAMARSLGADDVQNPYQLIDDGAFDVVFDTTGTPAGFARALALARRAVHLKSTHGQAVMGLNHLSDLVVEEQAILPCRPESLDWHWPGEMGTEQTRRANTNVYVSPSVPKDVVRGMGVFEGHRFHRLPAKEAWCCLQQPGDLVAGSPFPRFDLAIAGSLAEVDAIVRPEGGPSGSLLRPGGAVMLVTQEDNLLTQAVTQRGLAMHTSRCGGFRAALAVLAENPVIAATLRDQMITHSFPLDRVDEAFVLAADSKRSIKVMVETGWDT